MSVPFCLSAADGILTVTMCLIAKSTMIELRSTNLPDQEWVFAAANCFVLVWLGKRRCE